MSYPPQAPLSLVMRRGPQPDQRFTLDQDVITIGRAPENDLVIPDEGVSRHHARLTRQGNNWVLQDLGSRNGTIINRQRISAPVFLTPGSQVAFGPDVLFDVEQGPPAASETLASRTPAPISAGVPPPSTVVRPARPRSSGYVWLAMGAAAVVLILGLAAAAAYVYLNPSMLDAQLHRQQRAALPSAQGPFVAFQDPEPGSRVEEGEAVLVFATARDQDKVTRLDLWLDDTLMVQQTSPDPMGVNPLSLVYNLFAPAPGAHSLLVRAYNNLGEMGESPTINLDVLAIGDPEVAGPEPGLYVTQQGDTLESIAKKFGVTADAIRKANPGLGNTVQAGQIIAVPLPAKGVVVPPQAPDAWAGGQVKDGQQPVKPPQQTPQQLVKPPQEPTKPLPQPTADKKQGQPPVWDPTRDKQDSGQQGAWPADPPKDTLKAPVLAKPTVTDCKVTVAWQDRSEETRFLVKRSSGSPPAERTVAALEANKTTFEDQVPAPGKYTYTIVAEKIKGQSKEGLAVSNPQPVTVLPTTVCGSPQKTYKQVHFEPIYLKPADPKYTKAALFVALNNTIDWRIPRQERVYAPVGNWLAQGKAIMPAPVSLYLNPEESLWLDVHPRSCTDGPSPPDKNESSCEDLWTGSPAILPVNTLSSKDKRDLNAPSFSLSYRLWIEDVEWTGKGTTRDIPPPTLYLAKGAAEIAKIKVSGMIIRDPAVNRILWWEFPADKESSIDGFVVYRTYTCPHQNTQIKAPEIVNGRDSREVSITPKSEPVGCEAQYWVSAYGSSGESAPSNVITDQTSPSVTALQVDFKSLTIGQPESVAVRLYANQYQRTSGQMYVLVAIGLHELPFDGSMPNNVLVVQLDQDEALQFGLETDTCTSCVRIVGGDAGKACKVEKIIQPPQPGWESFKTESYTLRSEGTSPCEVEVEVKAVKSLKAGQAARPQADIEIAGIYFIGKDIYAALVNIGPDDLPANQVKITSGWKREISDPPAIAANVITRWWTPGQTSIVVKINTIPLLGDLDAQESLKRLYLDVETVPVDFTDPETSNNQKKNQKPEDFSQMGR